MKTTRVDYPIYPIESDLQGYPRSRIKALEVFTALATVYAISVLFVYSLICISNVKSNNAIKKIKEEKLWNYNSQK